MSPWPTRGDESADVIAAATVAPASAARARDPVTPLPLAEDEASSEPEDFFFSERETISLACYMRKTPTTF